MAPRKQEALAFAVESVRRQFEKWRRDPGRDRRIPEDLWQAAAELAREHGIWRTALALRLNNQALKERLAAAGSPSRSEVPRGAFIELSPPMLRAGADCVLELVDRQGNRMRVELRGCVAPDLAALTREFRRSEK
jgi:hypothetical protein